mgnify:CR=1 FL=1
MERWSLEPQMEPSKGKVRPLSIGRGLYRGITANTMPAVPERVPVDSVAPDGDSETKGDGPAPTHDELSEAYATIQRTLDGTWTHLAGCGPFVHDCKCGLTGFQRYLGL